MISCDPKLARILNASARQFELEQFARLELYGGGGQWVTASAKGRARAVGGRSGRLRAGVSAFLAIFR